MDMHRVPNTSITWDPLKFPSGMPHVAATLHSQRLKFGLYSARCRRTCEDYPASFGHEVRDAASIAHWNIDYLKFVRLGPSFCCHRRAFVVAAERGGIGLAGQLPGLPAHHLGGGSVRADGDRSERDGPPHLLQQRARALRGGGPLPHRLDVLQLREGGGRHKPELAAHPLSPLPPCPPHLPHRLS